MGRYLSVAVLGVSAALSASILPKFMGFAIALLGDIAPLLADTRGQLSLVLLFVICWSLRADLTESLVWAVVGGIMLDLLSILPLGATSFLLVLLAVFVNSSARQLLRVRFLFLLLVTPAATALVMLYSLAWLTLLGNSYDFATVLRSLILPTMIFNLIAVIPIYGLVRLVQRQLQGGLQIAPQSLTPGADSRLNE